MKVRFVAIATVVLCLTARAEQSASDPLETAKRDLRALPSLEKSAAPQKGAGFGSADIPSITPPMTSGAPKAPAANTPPSGTWLQDALDVTKAESSASRRGATDPAARRDPLRVEKTSRAADTFGQYVTQWLSPRDADLLRSQAKNENAGLDRMLADQTAGTSGKTDALLTTNALPFVGLTTEAAPKNPYLQEVEVAPPATSAAQPYGPLTSLAPATAQSAPAPVSTLPLATETVSATPGQRAKAPAVNEPASAPPTAPVVDDRKYFPQFRRF